MVDNIRIFLSSPGDVNAERLIVRRIVESLQHDPLYKEKMDIEIIAWDDPHSDVLMPITLTPQAAIDMGMAKPSECDIVITMLWGRMGTPLDEGAHGVKEDRTPYLSGTEWEFLDGLKGSRGNATGLPIVYLYRRTDEPPPAIPREGQDKIDADFEHVLQRRRVRDFFAQFRDPETGAYKAYYHEYDSLDGFKEMTEKHIRTLVSHACERRSKGKTVSVHSPEEPEEILPPTWDITTQGSPFPGLQSFEERHEPVFFGRERETTELIRRLMEQRLLVIVGASGSGKSSLVRAGLLPKLRDNAIPGSTRWERLTLKPNGNPFLSVAEALIDGIEEMSGDPVEYVERCAKLAEALAQSPENLHRTLSVAMKKRPETEVLLFIDQFEELFTLAKDSGQSEAFTQMLKHPSKNVRVVLTLRADFYDELLPLLEEELRETTFTLARPLLLALEKMIVQPAERAGLTFDEGLAGRIVEDTGLEPGALALTAYLLEELYKQAEKRKDVHLTWADYEALGGVRGAIGMRAESAYNTISATDDERQKWMQRVFRELVVVDDRGTATRQRASIGQFSDEDFLWVRQFADERLLVITDNHVEVAHEALFRSWDRLKDWIATAQEDLILLRQVRTAAHEWQSKDRPDYLLWPQERLNLVYAMQERLHPELNEVERDFIEPEQNRLLRELEKIETPHERRRDIGDRLSVIGDTRAGVGVKDDLPDIEWCYVSSGGEIIISAGGSRFGDGGDKKEYAFDVKPFYIAKYQITYPQFQVFLDAEDGFNNDEWWEGLTKEYRKQEMSEQRTKSSNNPRDSVSWYQCVAFTRWLNAKLPKPDGANENWQIRLPTEWEWQWAAQGGEKKLNYPWGDWQDGFANTSEAGLSRAIGVGMYPQGIAACGVLDMSGNLYEWCLNEHGKPNNVSVTGSAARVLRGGAFNNYLNLARCAYRDYSILFDSFNSTGFRVVCAAVPN